MLTLLITAVTGILGLFVGSFLNVVIDRLPNGETVVKGRSHCDHCNRTLDWFELIPVVSFLVQLGKCRTCHVKLSWKYPAIELLTAGCLAAFTYFFIVNQTVGAMTLFTTSSGIDYLLLITLICVLVIISLIDIRHGIIPDGLLQFLIVIYALYTVFFIWFLDASMSEDSHILEYGLSVVSELVDALLAGLFFYFLVWITGGRGMGGGDVKLAFVLGLFLSTTQTFWAIYLSFLIGGVYALLLLSIRKRKFGQTIPFGPFLAVGAYVVLVIGVEPIQALLEHIVRLSS